MVVMEAVITIVLLSLLTEQSMGSRCLPSITTVNGSHAPKGSLCKNQLIFNEDFNTFDLKIWHHDKNMIGGGVCST